MPCSKATALLTSPRYSQSSDGNPTAVATAGWNLAPAPAQPPVRGARASAARSANSGADSVSGSAAVTADISRAAR